MYTMNDLRDAVRILMESPFWPRYSVDVKRAMARELAMLLYAGAQAIN
jgi:hypothetical protein